MRTHWEPTRYRHILYPRAAVGHQRSDGCNLDSLVRPTPRGAPNCLNKVKPFGAVVVLQRHEIAASRVLELKQPSGSGREGSTSSREVLELRRMVTEAAGIMTDCGADNDIHNSSAQVQIWIYRKSFQTRCYITLC